MGVTQASSMSMLGAGANGSTPMVEVREVTKRFDRHIAVEDRKSVGEGKRVDLGGRRIIKKKKKRRH